ncbi:MAG TPA: aminoglycoside phosphotransferase family protein [Methylomirabilota bacterium]|nr:aminoglycoside phosphotransferase family protein [Methylomirabilota bacterium]
MNEEFVKKITALRGDLGKQWVEDIPGIIKKYEQEWDITCLPPFPLSYNYVAPAKTQDEKHVVLKISFPNNKEFPLEMKALEFYNGIGAIKILQEDIKNDVMLLEKAEPGTRVRDITPEKEQISYVSDLLKQFHKPIPDDLASPFPTIPDWAKAFDRYKEKFSSESGPIPQWMFEKAQNIFKEFPKEKKEHVLLHGDLHSDNILSSQRGWLVIDPKGIVGEREFELGTYLRNPYYDYPKGSDYIKLETERILQFSEQLGFDKNRLRDWAFACAVISLLWSLEDENYFNEIYIQNAELLNKIKF